jgi:hypothetical protein
MHFTTGASVPSLSLPKRPVFGTRESMRLLA